MDRVTQVEWERNPPVFLEGCAGTQFRLDPEVPRARAYLTGNCHCRRKFASQRPFQHFVALLVRSGGYANADGSAFCGRRRLDVSGIPSLPILPQISSPSRQSGRPSLINCNTWILPCAIHPSDRTIIGAAP